MMKYFLIGFGILLVIGIVMYINKSNQEAKEAQLQYQMQMQQQTSNTSTQPSFGQILGTIGGLVDAFKKK